MDEIDISRFPTDNRQTWLYFTENSDVRDSYPNLEYYLNEYKTVDQNSNSYKIQQEELFSFLDGLTIDKNRFDSRTFTRPKKRTLRPGLPDSMMNHSYNLSGTKTITKHSKLKMVNETFSMEDKFNSILSTDGDSDTFQCNETFQIAQNDSVEDVEDKPADDFNSTFSYLSKPININLQEPVHNIHNTFSSRFPGFSNNQMDSFTNISPPSLVSSIAMDGSGNFNSATFSRQGSMKKEIVNDANDDSGDQTVHNSLCSSMSTSILDEKEMSTSFLSQAGFPDNDIDDMSSSMINSFDLNNMNTSLYGSHCLQSGNNKMDNSLISSFTFNNMDDSIDEKLTNGKSKFHLRKSFLNTNSDDQDAINQYFKSNKGDLSRLADSLISSTEKREDLNSTFKVNDDSFLLNDKMSDSFLKCTGKTSLNVTYPKSTSVNNSKRQSDVQEPVLLPNQIPTPASFLTGRKSNGRSDTITLSGPNRNETFRKMSEYNQENKVDIDDVPPEILDSNKEEYISRNINDNNSPQHNITPTRKDEKRYLDGRTMTGSSSDSLEGSTSSERSPPQPTTVPLSMADLEYLAYQQHQSLMQDISTPLPNANKVRKSGTQPLYQDNALSPILSHSKDTLSSSTCSNKSNSPMDSNKYGTYRLNSSSTGSLNKMSLAYGDGTSSPRRLSNVVKRESSAPEIVGMDPPHVRNNQRLNQRVLKHDDKYGSDSGLHYGRRPINATAPSKLQYSPKPVNPLPSYNRTLAKYKQSPQLSGSTTELRSKQCGLPASKLRQYSSHKELNKIPGPGRFTAAGNLQSRSNLHSSNPALYPYPLTRQGSYTISVKEPTNQFERRDFVKPSVPPPREVIRSEPNRLGTRVTNNQNNIGGGLQYGQPFRAKNNIPSFSSGINKINVPANTGIMNPSYVKPASKPVTTVNMAARPANPPAPAIPNNTQRLPRPSGLPRPSSGIPRKSTLRPPSTYSLAPRPNDQTDCY